MGEIINIGEYQYELPAHRIAMYPLAQRDQSKLLVYNNGVVSHTQFNHVAEFLPAQSIIFFNDTRVIPARILFSKDTGAAIEIFLLSPAETELHQAMNTQERISWKCIIGNLKRWADGVSLTKELPDRILEAILLDRDNGIVKFEWTPKKLTFAEVLTVFGVTPLPPYIKRPAVGSDRERYQTIYSQAEGAVAAPTAGLHFTNDLIHAIQKAGAVTDYLTLHVSAGTFQPVKVQNALDHDMHGEKIIVTKKNLENLLLKNKKIVAIGTTSLRTLESLYWYGAKLVENPEAIFRVDKMDPYENTLTHPSKENTLLAVLDMMNRNKVESISGETSIYIVPGYQFKIGDALITNFHQPGSTLMLLVAAFVGSDWKKIYQEALANDYRFLSYGDSSLLIRP